jgi:hypothetical protein
VSELREWGEDGGEGARTEEAGEQSPSLLLLLLLLLLFSLLSSSRASSSQPQLELELP